MSGRKLAKNSRRPHSISRYEMKGVMTSENIPEDLGASYLPCSLRLETADSEAGYVEHIGILGEFACESLKLDLR